MIERDTPGPKEYVVCGQLVAKVIVLDEHWFTESEIMVAGYLENFHWNENVNAFLNVVAHISYPGTEVTEAYAALVCQDE